MKITKKNLLEFLESRKSWVSATEIAREFEVTPRTIRNRVRELNEEEIIILSSNLGYKLGENYVAQGTIKTQLDTHEGVPLNILNELLHSKLNGIRITELMDKHHLSESTLLFYLRKIRDFLVDFNMKISIKQGYVYLKASEKEKRRILNYILRKETNNANFFFDVQTLIPNIPVEELEKIIVSTVNVDNLFINELQLKDLLLHYAIMINRISEHHKEVGKDKILSEISDTKEYYLTTEICEKIEARYHLHLSDGDIQALALPLIGKTVSKDYNDLELKDLSKYISGDIIDVAMNILDKVKQEFYVDIDESSFVVRFIIHIKNLVDRYTFDQLSQNQFILEQNLQYKYPFLHEIALFVSNELKRELAISLNENEISYLVLHVGSFFKKQELEKINAVVVCPKYYDIDKELIKSLNSCFSEDIRISLVITNLNYDFSLINEKLVLSTTEIEIAKNNYFVQINPFLSGSDKSKIRKTIQYIKGKNRQSKLIASFNNFTSEETFLLNPAFSDRETCIQMVCENMVYQGIADFRYRKELLEREKLASTNFGSVAIPHSMKMNALKTCIFVVVSKDGICWGEGIVHLVLFVALKQSDKKIFGDLLESMINLLSNKSNVNQLLTVRTYQEFLLTIKELIENNTW